MTPKKAAALSKRIDVMCDEPFMFACKVGSGCHAKGIMRSKTEVSTPTKKIRQTFGRMGARSVRM